MNSSNLLDATPDILWHTLSKDVFLSTREELNSTPMSSEDPIHQAEVQPLLENGAIKEKKPKPKGVNWVMTSFLLVNAALGIGILNFPAAYNQAGGIISATIIQVVMVTLMMTTMLILAYCSNINGDVTYHDVLLSMCGRRAQRLAALSITCTLYCVCIACLIIIGDQLDSLFLTIFGDTFCHRWYLDRNFTIPAAAICFVLPMCYSKRVDFLGCVGSLGIFAMLYPVFLTVYGYFTIQDPPAHIKTKPDDITAMFAVIPVLGLGYQCQEVVVPVYACMRERNLWNFTKSTFLAMGFLLVIYSVTGCFGYLTFGANVAHNVMSMYDASDPIVMVGVGSLIIKMIVTYPILALCGRDAVGGLYAELTGLTADEFNKGETRRRFIVATLWFSSSLALAVFTDNIGIVIKYMGSVATANIFIYPGICLVRVAMKKDPAYESCKSRLLILLGIFITAYGAFCVGVVLLNTILTHNADPTIRMCT